MKNYYETQFETQKKGLSLSVPLVNAFLRRVFVIMGLGLAITGLTAFLFAQYLAANPAVFNQIFGSGLAYVVMFAPFIFVLMLSFGINRLSATTAAVLFGLFSLVMGISLSSIFFVYTGSSIALTFFVTAGTFAGMAVYGLTTKKDLTKFGNYLFMALIGIIIASVVNIFLQSSGLEWIISIVGVLLFAGLTAYDVQRLSEMDYMENADSESVGKLAVMGALSLYLDFINLFLFLLRFLGSRE